MTQNFKKKYLVYTAMCVLIAMLCIAAAPSDAGAAQKKISNACAKAYAQKINQLHKKMVPVCRDRDSVIIRDMNGDNVPELMYSEIHNSSGCVWDVYTYKKGRVKKIGKVNANELYRIPGSKSKYYCRAWIGVGVYEYVSITFSSQKVKVKKLADTNTVDRWKINGKSVGKKKFLAWEKKFSKKLTDKRKIKDTQVGWQYDHVKWTASKVKSALQ